MKVLFFLLDGGTNASIARLALVDPPVSGPGRRAYPSQLAWYVDSIALAREGAALMGRSSAV